MVKRQQQRRRGNRRAQMSVSARQAPNGSLRVRGEELLITVPKLDGVTSKYIRPGDSAMPMFDAYAKIFDRYRVEELRITYHASIGTTAGGSVAVGIDFDSRTTPTTFQGVLACVPKSLGPCYQRQVLTVPKRQLMSRNLLYTYRTAEDARPIEDGSAFSVVVGTNGLKTGTDASSPGFILVSYTAYFEGPHSEN